MNENQEDILKEIRKGSKHLEIGYYSAFPQISCTLPQIQKNSKARLKFLREIEDKKETEEVKKDNHPKFGPEFFSTIGKNFKTKVFEITIEKKDKEQQQLLEGIEFWKLDNLSHWILRLTYANSPEWFVAMENMLYQARLQYNLQNIKNQNDKPEKKREDEANTLVYNILKKFYDKNGFCLRKENRTVSVKREINQKRKKTIIDDNISIEHLRVPFEDSLRLMEKYQIDIEGGMSLIPKKHWISLLKFLYRRYLWDEMKWLEKNYEQILNRDQRLKTLINELPLSDVHNQVSDYTINLGQHVTARQINMLAIKHFPLCMKEMHSEFIVKHKLKHYGRLQFGLFLKGIGLSLKESLNYFKSEYQKNGDKKLSEYLYYIEHFYGKRGGKVSYSPYSCSKIINQNPPGAGDTFGCPFEHYGKDSLRRTLRKRFTEGQVKLILNELKLGKAKGACRKYFSVLHEGADMREGVGYHPNAYFKQSRTYHIDKEQNKGKKRTKSKLKMDEEKTKDKKHLVHQRNVSHTNLTA